MIQLVNYQIRKDILKIDLILTLFDFESLNVIKEHLYVI